MKLKSIEIKGFKSFYQKTKIEFPDGIVSIVGPNGSGKSNILDAFRWVLGEQSAKNLRGEKMEDVIFSGTARHNQSNFCEVEVIFENEDKVLDLEFSEISIKRKAFRSGESNYYINGKQARLKEIKELFLDSGIGKEGYSVISQGKIDEIVNATSVQRRKLLEEASGIARFRFKKEESEKKIENSKVNLERLEDIYKEIERQIEPLAFQKEKALEFLRLKEQLKKADVKLMLQEYDDIHESHWGDKQAYDKTVSRIEHIDSELEANKEEIVQFEENNRKSQELMQKLESEKNRLDLNKNNLSNEIQRYNQVISFKREQADKNRTLKEKQDAIRQDLLLQTENAKESINAFEKQYAEQKRKEEILSHQVDALTEKIKDNDREIEETGRKNRSLSEEISKNEMRIQFLLENIQREDIRQDESENNIHRTREKLEELFAQKRNQQEALNRSEEEYDTLYSEDVKRKAQQEHLLSEKEILQKELNNKNQYLREIYLKHSMYSAMEKDMEGINKSVRSVLENKSLSGIVDIVSNIISTDKKYEKAIETALGTSLQHIITTDSNSAKKAIEYLKKSGAGRATFLPMDSIKGSRLNLSGELLACDVVLYDKKFRFLIYQLLGRTIVVQNMDEAILAAKKYEHKYRIVTLDGEIFNVGGSITGGHYYKSNNILSRKRLIEEYRQQMEVLQEEVNALDGELNKVKESVSELSAQISLTEQKMNEVRKNLQSHKLNYGDISNRINYLNNTLENLLGEQKGSVHQKEENRAIISEIKKQQKELEETLTENRYILEELQNNRKDLTDEFAAKSEIKNQKKIELIHLSNELENGQKDMDRLREQIQSIESEIAESKKENLRLHEEIAESEQKITDTMMDLQLCEVEYDETIVEFEEAQIQLKKDAKKFESVSVLKTQLEQQRLQCLEEKFRLENKIEKVSTISEKIMERLQEEYSLDLESARALDLDFTATKETVLRLKKSINELGNVNIDAIKDYEILFERYETYRIQIEDLTHSIVELEQIIATLEKDMARDFTSSFKNISKTFGMVFSKMFGGGEGKLELSNSSDVLNSEIEIYAQPPGKKLKSISVMSGGEKALMGIALLFSIQMTKPAPFCILDEIDAALDDANIARFNVFLKQMSDNIQFITITHRRGTMENSDYIYGVTMQDKGVSKLVSLKFEDAQEYIEQ